jgi:paraquat-inducible protein B
MSDQPPPTTREPDIPEAVISRRSRLLPELIWAIPIVAALIGGWLAVKAIRSHGPTITISFRDAGGLAAGKTKLKYREVDVGEVRSIGFSPDRATVVVTAELMREAASWMVDDTRFWVVRPRIAAGEISGLETLLSGSYIGLDVGTSTHQRRDFRGLEAVPIVSGGTPGRAFVVRATRSIGAGSPVIFHHLQVGQVTASDFDADGTQVSIGVFVRAPYDRYVTTATRFWEASGVDVSLSTTGLKVETESLVTLILGGICFEAGPDGRGAGTAPPNHPFVLFPSRDEAMKQPDTEAEDYTLVFRDSVRGLAVGAPVDFRGVPLGEVTRIGVEYDPMRLDFTAPVDVRIYPGRLRARLRHEVPEEPEELVQSRLQRLVDHGLRAQLRAGNLLTGQLYVALDFFPRAPRIKLDAVQHPREIPTLPADDLGASLADVAKKVDRLPLDQVVGDVRHLLANAGSAFADADAAVKQFGPTSPRQADLDEVFQQVTRAARSLRALADSLERHPESLIRGRK